MPTDAEIRASVEHIVSAAEDSLMVLTKRRLTGEIDTLAWRSAVQAELRSAHMAATALAHGGLGNLTAAERGWAGSRLRSEYSHLASFGLDLATGDLSDAQVLARAQLYAHSVYGTHEEARRRVAKGQGFDQERNILGAAQHCTQCPGMTAKGWVPMGTLPAPGSRACLGRCRCRLEYRVAPASEAAA